MFSACFFSVSALLLTEGVKREDKLVVVSSGALLLGVKAPTKGRGGGRTGSALNTEERWLLGKYSVLLSKLTVGRVSPLRDVCVVIGAIVSVLGMAVADCKTVR